MEKQEALEMLKKDQFVQHNDIELVEMGDGEAIGKMTITPKHLNGIGRVQGGALFTLADYVCAAAANSRGKAAVSIDGQIDFIKAVASGTLTAHAKEVSLGRTIASYNATITNEENQLIAFFHAKFFRKD